MKMPSTTNVKVEAKPSTDVGDAAKQCINCLEKKVRNLEKRKGRIEINREKAEKGTKLEKEQEISLNQYEQVSHDLEFARELHKQFLSIFSEHEKMVKKQAKREKAERQAVEIKRVSELLQLQSTLDLMGGNQVREDFKTGKHGAVVLTDDNLDQLDKLYQAISPSRDDSGDDYPQRLNTAAEHMVNVLEGKDRQVLGTTYKELKELLNLINECGYFERANQAAKQEDEPIEPTEEQVEEVIEEPEETTEDEGLISETTETTPEPEQQPIDLTVVNSEMPLEMPPQQVVEGFTKQQPIDLTVGNTEPSFELPQQPINTMEQDAFFAPSSTPAYQENSENRYSPVYGTTQQNYESFTNNRPFQFIQASYVMPDSQATAPSVVDPAVIHAQPAANSSLYYEAAVPQPAPPQSQLQPQSLSQQPTPSAQPPQTVNLGMVEPSQPEPHPQQPSSQPPQPQQQPPKDYSSQGFSQTSLPQAMQPDALYPGSGVIEEVSNSMTSHSSPSPYEIPPSIPMPPSQTQDQTQLDQQQQQEKKFQMNASAPVFQSMYAQVSSGQSAPVSLPPPTVPVGGTVEGQAGGDYNNTAISGGGDYQQGYQGNGFNNGYRGRGGFRGPRGGGAPNGQSRNGNPGQMQNGYGNRGGPNQNRGRGGYSQGYSQNTNYRQDSYQGGNNYSGGGGFNKYPNRGGMNAAGGGNGYNPRGGPGGNGGRGGPGMRGMTRGGTGAPRGGRGGFNRPPPNQ